MVGPDPDQKVTESPQSLGGRLACGSGPDAGPAPVDFDRISEAAFDDPARMCQIMEMILRELPRELAAVTVAVAVRNVARVAQAAHKSCGACAQAGLVAVVPSLRAIEDAARAGSLEGASELAKSASAEFERCRRAIETRLRELERSRRA